MLVLRLIEVEFGRFPIFLGNGRASGMEIVSFEVMSKAFFEAFFPECSFSGNAGELAECILEVNDFFLRQI